MASSPLVSTIIPVYNRARLLREAVESALGQDYRPIEIIVVDDGSTDDTGKVAEALARSNGDVRVLHQPNGGPGLAREAGRRSARGQFIQYLDSDDLLLPGKLRAQVEGLLAHPDCGVAYGFTRYRNRDGSVGPLPWKATGHVAEYLFPSFLRERWWETATPLFRAEVCDRVGPWTDLRLEEDWEYDCRVAALGVRLHFEARYGVEIRDHAAGRLGGGGRLDPARLAQRTRAHALILSHARRADVDPSCPEMAHFARGLFLLARQCGAAGLSDASAELFALARGASGKRGGGLDFRLYEVAARALGWTRMGRLACWADSLRS
jgi:hypothetical protein